MIVYIILVVALLVFLYFLIPSEGKEKKNIEEFIKSNNIKEAIKVADDELEVFDAYQREAKSKMETL